MPKVQRREEGRHPRVRVNRVVINCKHPFSIYFFLHPGVCSFERAGFDCKINCLALFRPLPPAGRNGLLDQSDCAALGASLFDRISEERCRLSPLVHSTTKFK